MNERATRQRVSNLKGVKQNEDSQNVGSIFFVVVIISSFRGYISSGLGIGLQSNREYIHTYIHTQYVWLVSSYDCIW